MYSFGLVHCAKSASSGESREHSNVEFCLVDTKVKVAESVFDGLEGMPVIKVFGKTVYSSAPISTTDPIILLSPSKSAAGSEGDKFLPESMQGEEDDR